jgi:hypothetical protein
MNLPTPWIREMADPVQKNPKMDASTSGRYVPGSSKHPLATRDCEWKPIRGKS